MRKLITGIALMVSGLALHIATMFICSSHAKELTAWSDARGRFFEAMSDLRLTTYCVFSAVLFLIGVVVSLISIYEESRHKEN